MSEKQIRVVCPCCDTVLEVDVLTAKVMKHMPKASLDETGRVGLDLGRWDQAKEKVHGRHDTGRDHFDASLEREKNRDKDLDDLFSKAQEKAKKRNLDD
ncbi:MAG: hypothetical protein R3F17_07005 [Planctomycetota bacterium]